MSDLFNITDSGNIEFTGHVDAGQMGVYLAHEVFSIGEWLRRGGVADSNVRAGKGWTGEDADKIKDLIKKTDDNKKAIVIAW